LRNNAVSMTAAMVQVVQIAPLPSSMAWKSHPLGNRCVFRAAPRTAPK
jgi:hypothetical protein